ncbi:CHASE domain-containing protein, partial [Pseudomonadota bacterium]|nr:CHASE domain-containing protein [Pseudomonadota bacterium]
MTVVLFLLTITVGIWNEVNKLASTKYQEQFNFRVQETHRKIEYKMVTSQQILEGARGVFVASQRVSHDEFKSYVASLDIDSNFPGIQGVGFSRVILPEQKQAHIDLIRKNRYAGYDIKPEGERELYTSIIYLEPFDERNFRAFGYDMYSNDVRRRA